MKAKIAKAQLVELEKGEYAVVVAGHEVNRYHNLDAAVTSLSFVPLGSETAKYTASYKGHTIVQTLSAYFVTTTAAPFKSAHLGFAFKHIDQAVA